MAQITPIKPFLLMFYGFPGAGKTYFSRQFCENVQAAHVQADRIRGELFDNPRYDKQENNIVRHLMDYMTEEFLGAGISVVYDISAMRARQRHELRALARRCHAQPLLVWLQMDHDTAFTRNIKRDRRRADDKYAAQLDRTSYEEIIGHMQNPVPTEDYVVISGKHLFGMQQSAVISKLRDMGVMRIDDANSRVIKPGMVNLVPGRPGRVDMTRRDISVH